MILPNATSPCQGMQCATVREEAISFSLLGADVVVSRYTMGGAMPDMGTPGGSLECRALEMARVTVRTATAYADTDQAARYASACAPVSPPAETQARRHRSTPGTPLR